MSASCIGDAFECKLDNRCPACTIARLRGLEKVLSEQLASANIVAMSLDWALTQALRASHRGATVEQLTSFLGHFSMVRDADPKLLRFLGEDV